MKCPSCETETLVMTERQGIEIDYCPKCRGVWLDRGELDKILERSAEGQATGSRPSVQSPHPQQPPRSMHDNQYQYKKRKNWLSELFD